MDNIQRAHCASIGLDAYAKAKGQLDEPIGDNIADMITDLLHLAENIGEFPHILHDRALSNYEDERTQ